MKKRYTFALAALLALCFSPLLFPSCSKDNVSMYSASNGSCTDTVSFAEKIQPLISENCATSGCHDPGTQSSGYNFTSYSVIAANAPIMISAMRHENGVAAMPEGMPQLADSLIQQFGCWIDQGRQNN